jgi:SLT domain-containing protein
LPETRSHRGAETVFSGAAGNTTESIAIGLESTRRGQENTVKSIYKPYQKKIASITSPDFGEYEKVREIAHMAKNLNRRFGKATKIASRVAIPLSLIASVTEIIGLEDKKRAIVKELGSVLGAVGVSALVGAGTGALVGAGVLSPVTALLGSIIGAGAGAFGGQAVANKLYDRFAFHAEGGIMTKPHMGIVAEAGPEAIIPLTKPSRAKVLWQQVGNIMGFTEARTNAIGENLPQVESVSEITKRYTNVKDIAENTKRLADVVDITRYRNLKQKDKTLTERLKHFTTTLNQAQKVNTYATGGILTKPHMGLVAEDGAEGIIPLSPSKRQRGLDLWQRTGELLGVRAYEDGGIVGEEPDEIPVASATGRAGQNITIKVEVKAEPKFTIEGSGDTTDENKVLAVLKAYIREMTDDIGDELAERLARIFANMPVKGGAEA